ncbi:MAG: lytic transglycosylase domain-containing protein [Chthoniobacterales bacterium]|jgi:soluble lytic murein transglycosylase
MASRSERSQIRRLPSLLVSWLIKLALVLVLSAVAAVGYLVLRTKDPLYVVRELKNWSDFKQYDSLITQIANEHLLDPRLVKAVVWRESQFQTDMVGRNNERGLMQVSEIAAREWAKSNTVPNFEPNQLFNPEVNLEIGCWYLSKALQRWNSQTEPVPFALAEYNAGKSRVDRWIRVALQRNKQPLSAEAFEDSIDFPSTAHYVRTILARYDYYKRRGPLAGENQQTSAAE